MANIGALGDMVFSISSKQKKTFDKLTINSSVTYATHKRHLKKTIIEAVGIEADTVDFSMTFSVYLGTKPYDEIKKIDKNLTSYKVMPLAIGNKSYGKWVITKLNKTLEKFDNKGNLLHAKVSVSLLEYGG